METVAKILIGAAVVLALTGGTLLVASKLGLERLPGDISIEGEGFKLYVPVGLMILISVIGTILLNILSR